MRCSTFPPGEEVKYAPMSQKVTALDFSASGWLGYCLCNAGRVIVGSSKGSHISWCHAIKSHFYFLRVYVYAHVFTHTHPPATVRSAPRPVPWQEAEHQTGEHSTPGTHRHSRGSSPRRPPEQGQRQCSAQPPAPHAALPAHAPLQHCCSHCFSRKIALLTAFYSDRFFTLLFLDLSHALVMRVEVQTCRTDLSRAKE